MSIQEQIAFKKKEYWNAKAKKPVETEEVTMCFSCNKYPGMKGWQGYFRKQMIDGKEQFFHMECPNPKPTVEVVI